MQTFILAIAFFCVALIYSSVGFGGGSSYTALLVLMGVAYNSIAPISLISNIIVVSGNSINYARSKAIDFRLFSYLAIASVPMAFIGGIVPVSKKTFIWLLICALFLSGVALLRSAFKNNYEDPQLRPTKPMLLMLIGGILGLIAGFTGIGGGILLSPILYQIRAANSKQIAATASLFILVNSISGLIGQLQKHGFDTQNKLIYLLPLLVLIGGQIGNRFAIKFFTSKNLALTTAALVIFAAVQLFLKQIKLI
ncbi:MAG: sulfite exporter TauE/SafE family protein [Caulobacterales bacterium]|nr:sulfite exporter TauE/SafE family protein [Caulobacterales bacterium]MCA0372262.1 sulfite exporter TauE/SafE family protein [Pseudomonadota bacterium]